jgi:pantoate--beta-alanine ligase
MQKIESAQEMQTLAAGFKRAGQTVALVVTSGALHTGHAALMVAAKDRAAVAVVAVFPNPLAFGASEHFAKYPRTPEADERLCELAGADILFAPSVDEMFPKGFSTFVTEEVISRPLCGISRPTHFRGVTTGMAKLLNLVRPDVIIMGQRDVQQAAVVRKMVHDLAFGAEVIVTPTVREPDGLAIAVRNADLSVRQREDARAIYGSLRRAREMVGQGVRSPDRVIAEVTHLLGEKRMIRVIYIAIVDPATMESQREIVPGNSLLAIAAWVDQVRLIDNVML